MNNTERFIALRQAVLERIQDWLNICCNCKSTEGAMEIIVSYPDIFDENQSPLYTIRLYSSFFGKMITDWTANTFGKALDKCEKDIKRWLNGSSEL